MTTTLNDLITTISEQYGYSKTEIIEIANANHLQYNGNTAEKVYCDELMYGLANEADFYYFELDDEFYKTISEIYNLLPIESKNKLKSTIRLRKYIAQYGDDKMARYA